MIGARVSLGGLSGLLAAIARPDLRPVWKEARKPLRADIKAHKKARAGEDGAAWPALAASTVERYRRTRGRRRRGLLGKLTTALRTVSDRRRVGMISRVAWSDAHNRPGGDRVGRARAHLRQRQFLYVSRAALDLVSGMVATYVAGLFKRST